MRKLYNSVGFFTTASLYVGLPLALLVLPPEVLRNRIEAQLPEWETLAGQQGITGIIQREAPAPLSLQMGSTASKSAGLFGEFLERNTLKTPPKYDVESVKDRLLMRAYKKPAAASTGAVTTPATPPTTTPATTTTTPPATPVVPAQVATPSVTAQTTAAAPPPATPELEKGSATADPAVSAEAAKTPDVPLGQATPTATTPLQPTIQAELSSGMEGATQPEPATAGLSSEVAPVSFVAPEYLGEPAPPVNFVNYNYDASLF